MRRRQFARILPLVLVAALVPALTSSGPAAAETTTSVDYVDRAYTPLNPARVLDTRNGQRVGAGGSIDVQMTGAGGVPATGVGAVVFNLTGTGPSSGTYVTAFPTGQPRPTASNLNLSAGQTIPNLVVAKVGTGGKVTLYNDKGSVDLIVDVVGWFAVGSDFTGLTPARVLDTRTTHVAVPAKSSIDVQVTGAGGVPAEGVGGVVFNLTGTGPTAATYVTAYPTGDTPPTASNLNLLAGQTAPNLVVAKVGEGGQVTLYNDSGSVDLIVDVVGWFALGSDYAGVNPSRLFDSRLSRGPLMPQSSVDVKVTGLGGIPEDGVGAVVFNLTGTQPTRATYVTAYPTGAPRPTASNLNLLPGQTAPNLVVAKVGEGGRVTLFNDSGTVHLIVDVVGWISTGISAHLEKPATTELVEPGAVTAISTATGDVTITGPAPTTDEIVYVPPAEQTGEGLLGRVVSAETSGGATTLHTTPVLITDAFPTGQISGSLDTGALAPAAPASAAKSLAGKALQANEQGGAVQVDEQGRFSVNSASKAQPCGGSVLQIDVGVDVSARVSLDVSWGFGKLERLKFVFQVEVTGHVTVTAGASVKCEFPIAGKLRMGAIWGFVPEIEPRLRVDLTGGITETAEVKGRVEIGAEYRDGSGIRWIYDGGVNGHFTEPSESVSGKLKVAFGPKMALKFAGIVGPAVYGALFIEATLTPLANPWFRVDAGVSVEGTFDVDLWFTKVSYTLAAIDVLRFELSRAGAVWPQDGYGADRSGVNPNETTLSAGNVASLGPVVLAAHTGGQMLSKPVAGSGSVFYIARTTGGSSPRLIAVNPANGTMRWQRQLPANSYFTQSPVLAGGRVIVQGTSGLSAYSAVDGHPLWTNANLRASTCGSGNLATDSARLYVFTGSGVHGVNPANGAVQWSATPPVYCFTGIAASGGRVFAVSRSTPPPNGTQTGTLHAFDAASGAVKWTSTTPVTMDAEPAVGNGLVYVDTQFTSQGLLAFDVNTGAVKWRRPDVVGFWNTPAVTSGALLVTNSNGAGQVPLQALNPLTGATIWQTNIPNAVADGDPVVANGVVYFGSRGSTPAVYAVRLDTGARLATLALSTGGYGTFSPDPIVVNGRIYVTQTLDGTSTLRMFKLP